MQETRSTLSVRLLVGLGQVRRWVTRELVTWVREPRRGWITIAVTVTSYLVAWTIPAHVEPRIRWLGMFFQLLGIATVAFGIKDVRRLFGKPSLGRWIKEWLERFPPLRGKHVQTTVAAGGGGFAGLTGGSRGSSDAPPGAGVLERLAVLETNVKALLRWFGDSDNRAREAFSTLEEAVAHVQADSVRADTELNRKLEESSVGGISLEIMGVVWLTIGIVLASTSVELARWFPRFFPPLF